MKRFILAAFLLPTIAFAQPAQPPAESLTLPGELVNRIVPYLLNGGVHAEGAMLAGEMRGLLNEQKTRQASMMHAPKVIGPENKPPEPPAAIPATPPLEHSTPADASATEPAPKP